MKFLSAKAQMALGLVCLQVSVLCGAMLFGLVPERKSAIMRGRADLCESMAILSSQLLAKGQVSDLELLLTEIVTRNESVLSAGIRRADGELFSEVGVHQKYWQRNGKRSTENEVLVPIQAAAKSESAEQVPAESTLWGNVELRFAPISREGLAAFWSHPWVLMTMAISAVSGVFFYLYLRKMLKHLDPSKAVPQRVRAALDSLAEGLLVLDGDERIVLANQAFADWVDVSPDALTGVAAASFDWKGNGDGNQSIFLPWTEALRQEKAQAGVMVNLQLPGRPLQNLMANASPVLGHDGKYGGVLVSFDDVTMLEETRKDLSVAKETAEHAQQQAEEANKAKSSFLARMSHEIRTPMNAILGYTEVLRNGFDERLEDRLDYLNTIHASGEHLLALINDILDVSKIESGRMDLNCHRHSLRDLVSQVLSVMDVKAKEKQLGLTFKAATLVPGTIYTDAVRLRQILFNLVGNALKFTEEGEVQIVLSLRDDLLQVDVVDTGIGIDADAVRRVFDRFTQADASVTTRFGGTGLGLSISRQLARMMGGDVTVSSVLGQGSTFTLTIDPGPLEDTQLIDPTLADTQPGERVAAAESLELPPCRILIVDDEQANRNLAGIYINRAGGEFITAVDGQQAIDTALRESVDAILMDFHMPVLGGLEATRRLRAVGCTTPIIALTANVMEDDEETAREAGCDGFLRKPIRMADLVKGLKQVLPETLGLLSTARNSHVDYAARGGQKPDAEQNHPVAPVSSGPTFASDKVQSSGASPVTPAEDRASVLAAVSTDYGRPVSESAESDPIESLLPTDDPEIYEIVADFLPRLRSRVPLIRQCMDAGDFDGLREHAHWLAGSGAMVGFDVFSDPASQIEAAAMERSTDGVPELVEIIENLTKRVVVSKPATAPLTT